MTRDQSKFSAPQRRTTNGNEYRYQSKFSAPQRRTTNGSVSDFNTASVTCPPPGSNATAAASRRMIATFLTAVIA